jgi:hypothetical protein
VDPVGIYPQWTASARAPELNIRIYSIDSEQINQASNRLLLHLVNLIKERMGEDSLDRYTNRLVRFGPGHLERQQTFYP